MINNEIPNSDSDKNKNSSENESQSKFKEFLEYANHWFLTPPHKVEGLTKIVLKPDTPDGIIQMLEGLIIDPAFNGQIKHIPNTKVFIIVDSSEDDKDRSFAESRKFLGDLVPVYFMADGKTLVDGRHRLAECPDWANRITLKDVDTEDKAILTDLTLNCNKRIVPPEEKRQKITILAGKWHYNINEITQITGLGRSTVDKYFPKELKMQGPAKAGRESGKARALKAQIEETKTTDPILSKLGNGNSPIKEVAPIAANPEEEPEIINEEIVLSIERNQPTILSAEEKAKALFDDADKEQQNINKLVNGASAKIPETLTRNVLGLASDPLKNNDITATRLSHCLNVAVEVLLEFAMSEGKLEELLEAAKSRW